jgi:chromosome transmission fidelity protein 1
MSVICSVVHWLQAEEKQIIQNVKTNTGDSTSAPAAASSTGIDWLDDFITSNSAEQERSRQQQDALAIREVLLQRIARKKGLKPLPLLHKRHSEGSGGSSATDLKQGGNGEGEGEDEGENNGTDENLLCHYDSDNNEASANAGSSKLEVGYDSGSDGEGASSPQQAEDIPLDDKKRIDLEPLTAQVQAQLQMPKIFYCSRTHTQLTQFISEVKKATGGDASTLRCITLGSRSNMCINPAVQRMSSDAAKSEKCLDMQNSKAKAKTKPSTEEKSSVYSSSSSEGGAKKRQRVSKPPESRSGKKESDQKCEFHTLSGEQHLAEHALGSVRDIEDLVALGGEVQACPYYAARRALSQAQVVCLPYNLVLSQQSRAALGISLQHNVVIFDEAHNIVEAANMVHSAEVSHAQLSMALLALKTYLSRFRNVLNGKNFYYLNLLISMVTSFLKLIVSVAQRPADTKESNPAKGNAAPRRLSSAVYTVNDFVFLSSIDNVNLRKVARYTEVTHLVRKVGGHVDSEVKKAKEARKEALSAGSSSGNRKKSQQSPRLAAKSKASLLDPRLLSMGGTATHALRALFSLLTALQNSDNDGRIFVAPSSSNTSSSQQQQHQHTCGGSGSGINDLEGFSIQYVLLNPSNHFSSIVEEARSVLFLGGTLQPFDFILSSLLPQCVPSKLASPVSNALITGKAQHETKSALKLVDTFSCSHIIPSSHITTCAVRTGPSNVLLDFRHGSRDKDQLVRELFWAVYHVCLSVPHGVVLFFTSYAYMDFVVVAWRRMLLTPQLGAIKHICVEQRRGSSGGSQGQQNTTNDANGDSWGKYCNCIHDSTNGTSTKGALLLSVMGGKLSEGINFSDDLARAVVIVGMPYPDLSDPLLKEKLSFAERVKKGSSKHIYEGMCMKSVNQSIGRAIRHIGDYAAVVLLDNRYSQQRVSAQLPNWILRSSTSGSSGRNHEIFHSLPSFQDTITSIKHFFTTK